jgi:hypothetical protein
MNVNELEKYIESLDASLSTILYVDETVTEEAASSNN